MKSYCVAARLYTIDTFDPATLMFYHRKKFYDNLNRNHIITLPREDITFHLMVISRNVIIVLQQLDLSVQFLISTVLLINIHR